MSLRTASFNELSSSAFAALGLAALVLAALAVAPVVDSLLLQLREQARLLSALAG